MQTHPEAEIFLADLQKKQDIRRRTINVQQDSFEIADKDKILTSDGFAVCLAIVGQSGENFFLGHHSYYQHAYENLVELDLPPRNIFLVLNTQYLDADFSSFLNSSMNYKEIKKELAEELEGRKDGYKNLLDLVKKIKKRFKINPEIRFFKNSNNTKIIVENNKITAEVDDPKYNWLHYTRMLSGIYYFDYVFDRFYLRPDHSGTIMDVSGINLILAKINYLSVRDTGEELSIDQIRRIKCAI